VKEDLLDEFRNMIGNLAEDARAFGVKALEQGDAHLAGESFTLEHTCKVFGMDASRRRAAIEALPKQGVLTAVVEDAPPKKKRGRKPKVLATTNGHADTMPAASSDDEAAVVA
jgi:hypothetical protein